MPACSTAAPPWLHRLNEHKAVHKTLAVVTLAGVAGYDTTSTYMVRKVPLKSQEGTGVVSDSQVEVLWRTVHLQAAVCLPPKDFSGQGLFEAPVFTLLQTGHDHLRQVLLEPLEVLPEGGDTRIVCTHFFMDLIFCAFYHNELRFLLFKISL